MIFTKFKSLSQGRGEDKTNITLMSDFFFLFPSLAIHELTETQSSVFHFIGLASC